MKILFGARAGSRRVVRGLLDDPAHRQAASAVAAELAAMNSPEQALTELLARHQDQLSAGAWRP